jgi:hypothetical protein
MGSFGTRKRVRDILQEEGIETKYLKLFFEPKTKPLSRLQPKSETKLESETEPKNQIETQTETKNICSLCEEHKKEIIELNKKFDSMIHLQSKLISLIDDINYRFNDKGQLLSYIM